MNHPIGVPRDNDNAEDDEATLSPETLAALQEFYRDREKFENSTQIVENWNMSQFWYDRRTAEILASECVRLRKDETSAIACLCSPTVFEILLEKLNNSGALTGETVRLFEFDKRFETLYSDFYTFYDYNFPVDNFPTSLKCKFDIFLIDPPFLSEECLTKIADSVNFLSKLNSKIILCTGAIMENLAAELFRAKPCEFRPQHVNKLSNEFSCYVNYDDTEFLNNT